MFTWKYDETIDIDADADSVWAIWSNPAQWPSWDAEIKSATLDGDFIQGSLGKMKPASGPEIKFEITDAQPGKQFTNRAKLPLTTLDFSHVYLPASDQTPAKITHGVEFRGIMAPLFGALIGRNIKKHLRTAMLELAHQAKANHLDSTSKCNTYTAI